MTKEQKIGSSCCEIKRPSRRYKCIASPSHLPGKLGFGCFAALSMTNLNAREGRDFSQHAFHAYAQRQKQPVRTRQSVELQRNRQPSCCCTRRQN
jgi:hypothetical protein